MKRFAYMVGGGPKLGPPWGPPKTSALQWNCVNGPKVPKRVYPP